MPDADLFNSMALYFRMPELFICEFLKFWMLDAKPFYSELLRLGMPDAGAFHWSILEIPDAKPFY